MNTKLHAICDSQGRPLNLFVTAGVAQMSVMQVVRAALPFVGIMFVFLILVTYVPWISTFLPTAMMGPELITR